jgi:AsmA protein
LAVSKRAWWLGAVGALLILPPAAIGLAVTVVDPNDYKPQLIAAVQQATGRTLSLGGALRISRSLWPTIEVSDVKLANLPGGTRPDMARVERIEAQLSLPALLWRRIELIKLTLVGPNILFEQVGDKPNWVFDTATSPSPNPGASSTPRPHPTLRFRTVHVQNGMVTFHLPARTKVVGIRTLDFQRLIDGGPLQVASVLVYSDYAPFSLRASAQPTAGDTDPWTTQLAFAAYDTTASAWGTMNLAGDYDLQVEAQAGALEKLNALLPQMRLPALRQMSVSTHLTNGPVRGDLPVIGKTQLHVGSADLGDRLPGLTLGAVDVALPQAGALATITGSGSFAGQGFSLGGNFGVPEHPDGPVNVPIDLTAQSHPTANGRTAPGSLAVKGKLALNTGSFDGLDAAVALRTPALAALRPVVSRTLPALTDVSLDTRLVVPGDIRSLSLSGLKLATHEGDLSGNATIGLAGTAALDGHLHATRLDLDALLTAFGRTPSTGAAVSGRAVGPMIPNANLPWTVLRGPVIAVTATVDALSFQQQVWRNLDVALQLKAGRMDVSRLQVALPGGPLTASLTADAATDAVPVTLSLHAPAIPLALIAHQAGLPGRTSGALRVDADLRAAGRSAHDLAASLDGSVAATMTDGSLSNAALLELTSAALKALSIQVPAQGETAIRCLGLIGSFHKGVGRFRTIALDTTYLKLDGIGQIDFGAETVALKLRPLAQLAGSSVSVPVLVEGPFHAVQGRLDASGLDKLGLLIDAWFGGDQPETCSDAGLVPRGGSNENAERQHIPGGSAADGQAR